MEYLRRNVRLRLQPDALLPGARSILCGAINYKRDDGYVPPGRVGQPPAGDTGRVAQYARGVDYHRVLRQLLTKLIEQLQTDLGEPFDARVFVDTGPLLERELAARAGLGWIGRNTCVLHPQHGSYLLLGEVVTTLELPPDEPLAHGCGRCRRCLDACPTGALVAPHQIDASRCISYLTIERRASIAANLQTQMGAWVFGCDLCQQVCPYNARAPRGTQPDIMTDVLPGRLNIARLLRLGSGEYRRMTRNTAATRARAWMWQRNAAIAAGNLGARTPTVLSALRDLQNHDRSEVRDTVKDVLGRWM